MVEILLLASLVLEGLIYTVKSLWRVRRFAVAVPLVLMCVAAAGILRLDLGPAAVAVAAVSVFRLINFLRIAKGRMHERYLLRAARRTGLVLGGLQLLALAGWLSMDLRWGNLIGMIVAAQALAGVIALYSVIRSAVKTRYKSPGKHIADKDLPTVSVAIPARNETTDLEVCLRSVLASDYPKLEILVLDDCSHDKTAEIIKSFAHDGVRFVKGYEPKERWLAKNQAYDKLASEASGQLLLFCGVDVRFGPAAIRSMVMALLERKKDMLSILPRRMSADPLSSFVQPMRYWWELALPRRFFNRPPVLSTCWMIRRKALKKLGGLEAVQHAIIPEGYFARELVKTDKYGFLRADSGLDVQTRKSPAAQRETAVRMRYPQTRRRPEWVMLISLAEVILLLAPFGLVIAGFWTGFGLTQWTDLAVCLILILNHVLIMQLSSPPNTLIALFNFPAAVIVELVLTYMSMLKYEFSDVKWKGRNVCIPVMHAVPHLPKVDKGNSKT